MARNRRRNRQQTRNVICEHIKTTWRAPISLSPSHTHTQTHTHIAPLFVAGVTLRISWLNGNVNCRVIACNCIVNSRHSGLLSMLSIVATHATLPGCCCLLLLLLLRHLSIARGVASSRFPSLSSNFIIASAAVASVGCCGFHSLFPHFPPCLVVFYYPLSSACFASSFPAPLICVSVCCAFIKRHSCMAPHATICELRLK